MTGGDGRSAAERAAELDIVSGIGQMAEAWAEVVRAAAAGDLAALVDAARWMENAAGEVCTRALDATEHVDDRCSRILDRVPWNPALGLEGRNDQYRQVRAAEAAAIGRRLTAALRTLVPPAMWVAADWAGQGDDPGL